MLLSIYRVLFRITRNRKWIIRYIDEMDYQVANEIAEFRKSKEE